MKEHHIHFQPGVNEDLAATAIWGTQQSDIFGDCKYDGVYALWYGKGPGVDRCGDVFRHGNAAGSSKLGGVLVLAGDDHAAKSSTTAHQCEYAFMDAMIPHHQSAIDSGRLALSEAEHPDLIALADEMVTAQLREIDQMSA